MTTLTATEARKNFFQLMAQTNQSHHPVRIKGKNGNAVLMSEEDWDGLQETLFLLSIPNMRESILEGMAEPVESCVDELKW